MPVGAIATLSRLRLGRAAAGPSRSSWAARPCLSPTPGSARSPVPGSACPVHVPSLPRRRVRSSRPPTVPSGAHGVRRAIAGDGERGIFHRPTLLRRRPPVSPDRPLPNVLDSLTGQKGGQVRTREPPAPAPAAGDGRRDRLAAVLRAVEVEVGEVGLRTVVGELDGGLERLVEHERVAVKRG